MPNPHVHHTFTSAFGHVRASLCCTCRVHFQKLVSIVPFLVLVLLVAPFAHASYEHFLATSDPLRNHVGQIIVPFAAKNTSVCLIFARQVRKCAVSFPSCTPFPFFSPPASANVLAAGLQCVCIFCSNTLMDSSAVALLVNAMHKLRPLLTNVVIALSTMLLNFTYSILILIVRRPSISVALANVSLSICTYRACLCAPSSESIVLIGVVRPVCKTHL